MLRKLVQVDAAERLEDLRAPPEDRLEALERDRRGQHGIRIDDPWRVCFRWRDGEADDVAIVDYHRAVEGVPMPRTARATEKLPPVHPGEVLLHDFLEPLGLSQYRVARDLSVPPRRINEIVHGKRAITADTALRLARYFGTSEQFWLNLQTRHDLDVERDRLGSRLAAEVAVYAGSAA